MKSTANKPLACDALWNERQAHSAMQQSKEQVARDRIADRNARTRLDEQLRKERVNSALIASFGIVLGSSAILSVWQSLFTRYFIFYRS